MGDWWQAVLAAYQTYSAKKKESDMAKQAEMDKLTRNLAPTVAETTRDYRKKKGTRTYGRRM